MASNIQLDIKIDKLTRSIENLVTGDSFETEILLVSTLDLKQLKKTDWLFDWNSEAKSKDNS